MCLIISKCILLKFECREVLAYGLVRHQSLAAQWLEHLTGVRKVIGSTPVGDSDFFSLFHARDIFLIEPISLQSLDIIARTFNACLKIFSLFASCCTIVLLMHL